MTNPVEDFKASLMRWQDNTQTIFNNIVARFNDFSGANLRVGEQHLQLGNFTDAILRFRMVLWKLPNSAQAHSGLAVALLATGDHVEAMREAKATLAIDASNQRAQEVLETLARAPESEARDDSATG